eukprot:403376187
MSQRQDKRDIQKFYRYNSSQLMKNHGFWKLIAVVWTRKQANSSMSQKKRNLTKNTRKATIKSASFT